MPGNPYGIHVRQFDQIMASLTRNTVRASLFNRVYLLGRDHLSLLDSILEWYQVNGAACCFDIVPPTSSASLLWHLTASGFSPSGFYNVFYGYPRESLAAFPTIIIREVASHEKDLFADLYQESFGLPASEWPGYVRDSIRVLVDMPSNRCFFACIGQTIVALGVLSLFQQTGYLALAATLPAFRRQGYQQALLTARIKRARAEGCDLIVGQAGVGTTSGRNMEKVGLRLAYTKTEWTPFDGLHPLDDTVDPLAQ